MRLFPNYLEMEEEYFERTKVWPIMHIIAMKKSILDENPWAARNLYNAFLESKRRSIERILDPAVSRYPVPWLTTYARKMRDMFGGDLVPVRHRREPPDLGADGALHLPAGHRAPSTPSRKTSFRRAS